MSDTMDFATHKPRPKREVRRAARDYIATLLRSREVYDLPDLFYSELNFTDADSKTWCDEVRRIVNQIRKPLREDQS